MRIRDWSSDVCSSDLVRLTRKSGDQAVPVMPGRSVEADGEQLKFPPRPFPSRVNNPGAIAVQVEKPPGQKHQRENTYRQNTNRQGDPSQPSPEMIALPIRRRCRKRLLVGQACLIT